MFFISPIKAIYSIQFYLKVIKESLWKAFLFLFYLCVLGSVFITFYIPAKIKPVIDQSVEQTAQIIPDITIDNGVISANGDKRTEIAPEALNGYKVVFDTASTEPGYPTQMQKENILIYVNKNTAYMAYNGQFQENTIPSTTNLTLNKQTLLDNKTAIVSFLSNILTVIFIFAFLLGVLFLTVIAVLVVFIISSSAKQKIPFKQILIIAIYLQAPILALDLILTLLPFTITGMNVILSLVIFVVYSNLIFAALRNENAPKEITQNKEEGTAN